MHVDMCIGTWGVVSVVDAGLPCMINDACQFLLCHPIQNHCVVFILPQSVYLDFFVLVYILHRA